MTRYECFETTKEIRVSATMTDSDIYYEAISGDINGTFKGYKPSTNTADDWCNETKPRINRYTSHGIDFAVITFRYAIPYEYDEDIEEWTDSADDIVYSYM